MYPKKTGANTVQKRNRSPARSQAGEFLEAEIHHNQQVSGTSIRELQRANALHKIALDEVGPEGVVTIRQIKPDALAVFIVPPSFHEWMCRLHYPIYDAAERRRRLETSAKSYGMAASGEYTIIVNDKLDEAVVKVDRLARFGELTEDQTRAREIAQKLYDATQNYLKQNT